LSTPGFEHETLRLGSTRLNHSAQPPRARFLILNSEIHVKSETLAVALKTLYQLQKIGYLRKLVFGLGLNISDILTYNVS
jgi:hypothetical protein